MSAQTQKTAARRNIRKAQRKWRSMSSRERALAQPEGRARARPGTTGEGDYFRIVVRPKEKFTTFRYHDVGKRGHVKRLAGKRSNGSWATQAWIINKKDAHQARGRLVADTPGARKVLGRLGSKPRRVRGDIFEAKDRPNIPEAEKPTAAQKRARAKNIRKAQRARW